MSKGRISLQDHNPLWAKQFESLNSMFKIHLEGEFIAIEHVGSTSIPDIKAKPILDIDIVIANDDVVLSRVIDKLEVLGYKHMGNKGIPGREAFKMIKATNELLTSIDHHLYVCKIGCIALQNHLNLRDHLRRHPDQALAYSQLKEELSQKFPFDMNAYVDGKTDFILNILDSMGMTKEDIQLIGDQNRL